ncbi:hypothetical protein [Synechococcus sp. PCC 7336]|uniref:hypothetical protein n=1 Tax=Synechococcus sp. PCC 7336 TaxID=195250 RepID=UPI000344ED36|nr:hypothetical protein [Synechococcus sp. PCC 7336]
MTVPPDEEQKLVNFLRQYCPDPPPADPALRDEILARAVLHPHSPRSRWRRWRWAIPPVVAAAILAGWLWPRPSLTTAELEELENYLISSWSASTTIEADPFDDWLQEDDSAFFNDL